jgi:hypothetical protein
MQLSYFKTVVKSVRQKLGDVEAKKVMRELYTCLALEPTITLSFTLTTRMLLSPTETQYVGMVIGNLTSVLQVSICGNISLQRKHSIV